MAGRKLLPGQVSGIFNFRFCYRNGKSGVRSQFLDKFLNQGFGQNFLIGKRHKWIKEPDAVFLQLFHVVFNIFCIGSYHRTVVMVACLRSLIALIRNAGIEDKFNSLLN